MSIRGTARFVVFAPVAATTCLCTAHIQAVMVFWHRQQHWRHVSLLLISKILHSLGFFMPEIQVWDRFESCAIVLLIVHRLYNSWASFKTKFCPDFEKIEKRCRVMPVSATFKHDVNWLFSFFWYETRLLPYLNDLSSQESCLLDHQPATAMFSEAGFLDLYECWVSVQLELGCTLPVSFCLSFISYHIFWFPGSRQADSWLFVIAHLCRIDMYWWNGYRLKGVCRLLGMCLLFVVCCLKLYLASLMATLLLNSPRFEGVVHHSRFSRMQTLQR